MKNHRRDRVDELQLRSPVETGLAMLRTMAGPLRSEVEAAVGSGQEDVAKRTLDYFHVPLVAIRGTVPWTDEDCLMAPRYRGCATYPFAFLVADLDRCKARWAAVDEALDRPGREAVLALRALKDDQPAMRSTLEPWAGLPPLSATGVAQGTLSSAARRHLRDIGELLRAARPFAGLSDGEAAVLASFTDALEASPGDVLVREGDTGEDLFVVCAGEAEVRLHRGAGMTVSLAHLQPRGSLR